MSFSPLLSRLLGKHSPEAYFRSDTLWPDPSLAPDVPSDEVLRAFLGNSEVTDDVRDQIEGSVNCVRRMMELETEPPPIPANAKVDAEGYESLRRVVDSIPEEFQAPGSLRTLGFSSRKPAPGDVWALRTDYKWFDGRRLREGYNYDLPFLLLLSDPEEDANGESFCRAMICSDLDSWGDRQGSDEVLFKGESGDQWILHLWLEFPVSLNDLNKCVDGVHPQHADRIAVAVEAYGMGLPLQSQDGVGIGPDKDEEEIWVERRRLYERARTIPSSLDAIRMEDETASERVVSFCEFVQNATEDALHDAALPLPMAAKTGEILEVAIWSGSTRGFVKLTSEAFAKVDRWEDQDGKLVACLDLSGLESYRHTPCILLETKERIATGRISSSGLSANLDGDTYRDSEQGLVLVIISS